ncbi:MAG: hypothetical protein JO342_09755 [Solirubrobacterales bacterium]|nr:hypothetical protein [Solirubrobacterales bacterium]MBV9166427.1 hypothetical protein [Solirubrobacterales bacterium]
MSLLTDVPDELRFRGIEPPQDARGFGISLDRAEPKGGGRIAGRVERRNQRRNRHPLFVDVRCDACWMDVAPELVGRKGILSWSAYGEIRNKFVPIWLDEKVFTARLDVGPLEDANWRRFAFDLPDGLPRAVEGTFVAFRWRIEARRARRVGTELASVPLLLVEPQNLPVVRVETSPIGTWRLLEWRSDADTGGAGGRCSVAYEARLPTDLPLPGETREAELARRIAA